MPDTRRPIDTTGNTPADTARDVRNRRMADDVQRAAESALDAIDAAARDLAAHRASVVAWAGGAAAAEPDVYGNRWCAVVDTVSTFRTTCRMAAFVHRTDGHDADAIAAMWAAAAVDR